MFIGFANFYRRLIQGSSKIATALISMLKMSLQLAGILLTTSVDDSKIVSSSGRNNRKLAKPNVTKLVHKIEKSSFLTLDTR